jgi:uncharacterized repeat protein (TIGR03803 family)
MLSLVLLTSALAGAAKKYKTLHKFNFKNGAAPVGRLIFDAQGNLYGTTYRGGANSLGDIYELKPNADGTWTERVLYNFGYGNDGNYPYAGLTFDSAGSLYGTTEEGGPHDLGTVFRLARNPDDTWTESVIKLFKGDKDGATPVSGLIFDKAGNLYGTAAGGGNLNCDYPNGCGVVFRLSPNQDGSWTESVIHTFCRDHGACKDGANPFAGLVFDPSGNLYGTTKGGGDGSDGVGVVFKLTPNADGSWSENVLHKFFHRQGDGAYPFAGVILDANGNIYGTTSALGDGWGTVFRLTPMPDGTWRETRHSFTYGDGGTPVAALTSDAAGNVYGTTSVGGINGGGTIFKLISKPGRKLTVRTLHSFELPENGPLGGVILDAGGNIYGAVQGSLKSDGLVFELTR